MIRQSSFIFRLGAVLALSGITTLGLPMSAISAEALKAQQAASKAAKARAEKLAAVKPSRELLGTELVNLRGKSGPNPYLSGSAKWGVNIDGVDITTGNLSLSSTDLSFEGGYGIPVNVTRTYSANNPDEGPLGVGWTLSVDLRSTAGGLLKSGGAPARSVPVLMKERPSTQSRERGSGDVAINEPVSAMLATDAAGTEETIQRDVDGIMMPPSWDQNIIDTQYETVILDTNEVYQIAKSQTITTPEGTVYVYEKHGEYVRVTTSGGTTTYTIGGSAEYRAPGTSNEAREPSNVLKIASVTDRHGNSTTYSYDTSSWAYYVKANGTVREHRLSSISMPGGRALYFTYGNGTDAPTNRLRTVKDFNSGSGRTATYTYGTGAETSPDPVEPLGYLKAFTTPGNKTTTYHYSNPNNHMTGGVPILRTVTDPRSLVTTFMSCEGDVATPIGYAGPSIYTFGVKGPNGTEKRFNILPDGTTEFGQFPEGTFADSGTGRPRFATGTGFTGGETMVYVNDPIASVASEYYRALTVYGWSSATDTDLGSIDTPFIAIKASRLEATGYSSTAFPWTRNVFSTTSQNLVRSEVAGNSQATGLYGTRKTAWYNFRGQPLREQVEDGYFYGSYTGTHPAPERTMVTDYAYWGKSKYFQQKAVRGPFDWGKTSASDIRYSFTDYYSDSATDGKKGQTYRVYRSGVDSNVSNSFSYIPDTTEQTITGLSATAGVDSTAWKRTIQPTTGYHAAEFDYDSDGRAISVKKLQKVVSGTPSYVETVTTYGADGGSTWGMPTGVVEDYGSGKINRTTTTEEYDRSGRAKVVIDGNGRKLRTTYDADGLVQMIELYTTGYGYGAIVTNDYLTNGQLEHPVAWNQATEQLISYYSPTHPDVGVRGQIYSVESFTGNDDSGVTYTYDSYGRRSSMETWFVNTPRRFEYRDYEWVGMPGQEQPVFTRLVEMVNESGWKDSKEEYVYDFDMSGRLISANFAPTPTRTTRNTNGNWYGTGADRASSYASQEYEYDIGGRLSKLITNWYKWNSGTDVYDKTTIRSAEYGYSGDFKLRTSFALKNDTSTLFTETYGYDAKLDYLTSASYSDQSSQNGTWTYDAAGNRSNSGYVYDNLNRMTNSPGSQTYTHDAVGNRTISLINSTTYTWDEFNQLDYLADEWSETMYDYLPGGLRCTKIQADVGEYLIYPGGSGFYDQEYFQNLPTTRYRYDGQMTLEEDVTYGTSPNVKVDETRYTLGARGIESMEAERLSGPNSGSVTTGAKYRSFPVYDGHGNMIATLTRSGTDSYTLGAEKRFNVWGSVRTASPGSAILNPNKQYSANLGHTRDEESGLIYMRARYYEPWTGRFISEDPARAGWNWYVYANDGPVMGVDASGRSVTSASLNGMAAFLISMAAVVASHSSNPTDISLAMYSVCVGMVLNAAAIALEGTVDEGGQAGMISSLTLAYLSFYTARELGQMATQLSALSVGQRTNAGAAVTACFFYSVMLQSMIMELNFGDVLWQVATDGSAM